MSDEYKLVSSEQTRFIKRPNGRYCIWNEHETVDEVFWALCPASTAMITERERAALKAWVKAKETKP